MRLDLVFNLICSNLNSESLAGYQLAKLIIYFSRSYHSRTFFSGLQHFLKPL